MENLREDSLMIDTQRLPVRIKELLHFEDEEFVRQCYRQILGREPDPIGFADHVRHLRMQELSKTDLIYSLCMSEEGQKYRIRISGINWRYKVSAALKKFFAIPFIGKIVRYFYKLIRLNKTIYQMMIWNVNIENKNQMFYGETSGLRNDIIQLQNHLQGQIQSLVNELNSQRERDIWIKCEYSALTSKINLVLRQVAELKNKFENQKIDLGQVMGKLDKHRFDIDQILDLLETQKMNVVQLQQGFESSNHHFEDDIQGIKERMESLCEIFDRLNNLEENISNNNILLNKHNQFVDQYAEEDAKLLQHLTVDWCNMKAELNEMEREETSCIESSKERKELSEDKYFSIDYFDFENRFRGSRAHIKEVQKIYLPYFENKNKVVDLGCGRGEFVELLQENGIGVEGIDLYQPYVEYCRMIRLPVRHDDAIHFLKNQDTVDGIFVGQVVEHLKLEEIIKLCRLAYEKLEKGCYFIMETPNPTSLAIYTESFYQDPSHNRPVHPKTLQYIVEKEGFSSVKVLYTESSRLPYDIPKISDKDNGKFHEFDLAMERVADLLYGSQDYALIARK